MLFLGCNTNPFLCLIVSLSLSPFLHCEWVVAFHLLCRSSKCNYVCYTALYCCRTVDVYMLPAEFHVSLGHGQTRTEAVLASQCSCRPNGPCSNAGHQVPGAYRDFRCGGRCNIAYHSILLLRNMLVTSIK